MVNELNSFSHNSKTASLLIFEYLIIINFTLFICKFSTKYNYLEERLF